MSNIKVVFEVPRPGPVPLLESPDDKIEFVNLDEMDWNDKKLIYMVRIITRGRSGRTESATLVIGFADESDQRAALVGEAARRKITVMVPTRDEKAKIMHDLRKIFERDVDFYK